MPRDAAQSAVYDSIRILEAALVAIEVGEPGLHLDCKLGIVLLQERHHGLLGLEQRVAWLTVTLRC